MMAGRSGANFVWTSLLAAGLLSSGWVPAFAQSPETPDATEQSRAAEYAALADEVVHLERESNVVKKVVKLVSPTVVHIEADKTDRSSVQYGHSVQVEEAGSGFIVKLGNRFYIVTNRHVIRNAREKDIRIKMSDARMIHPTRVWDDRDTDIAVMAIDGDGVLPARIGNSDAVEIGDYVLAVGSPFGLSHSVTFGIISAKGRRDLELGEEVQFQEFMQTDAAINPGNSGGPLINLRGEVIGMNTAIASSSGGNEGIGFTIPSNMVMYVARQLVERGSVSRAYLGVKLDHKFEPAIAVSLGLAQPRGARVSSVLPNSPAALARLQSGDVILEFGGVQVDNDSHLINLVSLTEAGREVPVVIYRDHKRVRLNIKVAPAESKRAATSLPASNRSSR